MGASETMFHGKLKHTNRAFIFEQLQSQSVIQEFPFDHLQRNRYMRALLLTTFYVTIIFAIIILPV